MKIQCQKCDFEKVIDDSKIPENCLSVKCPKCKNLIHFDSDSAKPVAVSEPEPSEDTVNHREVVQVEEKAAPAVASSSESSFDTNEYKKIKLMKGEEILWREKADVLFVSPNLIIKIMVKISYFFAWLSGNRHKGDITCTNKRIIYEIKSYFLWVLNYKSKCQTIYLNKLSGIDVGYEASFLIFFKSKVMTVYSSGMTAPTFVFKKISEEDLFNKVAKITDLNLSYAA